MRSSHPQLQSQRHRQVHTHAHTAAHAPHLRTDLVHRSHASVLRLPQLGSQLRSALEADRNVKTVISGGHAKRKGTPTVPIPRFTYTCIAPTRNHPSTYLRPIGGSCHRVMNGRRT